MQYLDWSRQAGEHGLIGNLLGPRAGRPRRSCTRGCSCRASRGGSGRGRPSRTCCGSRWRSWSCSPGRSRSCGASSPARDDRRLALVLALFSCSPVAALVGWGGLGDAAAKLAGGLRDRRAVVGHVPVGLPVHGDRGRVAAAGAARLRARRGGSTAAAGSRRRPVRAAVRVAAAVAGGHVRVRDRGGRAGAGGAPGARPGRAAARSLAPPLVATALAARLLLVCSATTTTRGRSPRWSTTCRAGRGGSLVVGAGAARGAGRVRLPAAGAATSARSRCARGRSRRCSSTSSRSARSRSMRSRGSRRRSSVLGVLALRDWLGERPVPAAAGRGGGRWCSPAWGRRTASPASPTRCTWAASRSR